MPGPGEHTNPHNTGIVYCGRSAQFGHYCSQQVENMCEYASRGQVDQLIEMVKDYVDTNTKSRFNNISKLYFILCCRMSRAN